MEITSIRRQSNSPLVLTLARGVRFGTGRLKAFWLSARWKSVVRRTVGKRKTLAVRETAALGDRRFVSVIQFERQRFLIGSSPSSITLLSKLPDESSGAEEFGNAGRREPVEKRAENKIDAV
jgi:flagellar biogenesis protein FliO